MIKCNTWLDEGKSLGGPKPFNATQAVIIYIPFHFVKVCDKTLSLNELNTAKMLLKAVLKSLSCFHPPIDFVLWLKLKLLYIRLKMSLALTQL